MVRSRISLTERSVRVNDTVPYGVSKRPFRPVVITVTQEIVCCEMMP